MVSVLDHFPSQLDTLERENLDWGSTSVTDWPVAMSLRLIDVEGPNPLWVEPPLVVLKKKKVAEPASRQHSNMVSASVPTFRLLPWLTLVTGTVHCKPNKPFPSLVPFVYVIYHSNQKLTRTASVKELVYVFLTLLRQQNPQHLPRFPLTSHWSDHGFYLSQAPSVSEYKLRLCSQVHVGNYWVANRGITYIGEDERKARD